MTAPCRRAIRRAVSNLATSTLLAPSAPAGTLRQPPVLPGDGRHPVPDAGSSVENAIAGAMAGASITSPPTPRKFGTSADNRCSRDFFLDQFGVPRTGLASRPGQQQPHTRPVWRKAVFVANRDRALGYLCRRFTFLWNLPEGRRRASFPAIRENSGKKSSRKIISLTVDIFVFSSSAYGKFPTRAAGNCISLPSTFAGKRQGNPNRMRSLRVS